MQAPTPVLLGYADRFSVAPGESIRFMVSCEAPTYRAQLVRLIHGDANPAGPGYREERLASSLDATATLPGRRQAIAAGSYVRVPVEAPIDLSAGLTMQAWVWPTTPDKPGGQGILACASAGPGGRGFDFGLDDDGRLLLDLYFGSAANAVRVTHRAAPLPRWRWAFVAASFDPRSRTVQLYQASAEPYGRAEPAVHEEHLPLAGALALPRGDLLIAASGLSDSGQVLGAYNGKIDRPRLFDRPL